MTQNTPSEDELDLRPYVAALFKRKWLILLVGASFAAVAFIQSYSSPRTYTAVSNLLLTRSRATLSLAEEFPTVNEPTDTRSRMEALIAMGNSQALAQRTIEKMGDDLPAALRSAEVLSGAVDTSAQGDSLQVKATFTDSETAAAVANTWARELATTINLAYSGEQPLNEIQEKLVSAQSDYESAQAALENFIGQNPAEILEAELKEARVLLNLETDQRVSLLAYYYLRSQAMEQVIANAQALKAQIDSGSRSASASQGDALAVLLARVNSLEIPAQTIQIIQQAGREEQVLPPAVSITENDDPFFLQLGLPEASTGSSAGTSADVDGLIQLAEEEKSKADERIRRLNQEIVGSKSSTGEMSSGELSDTAVLIQDLNQQIEKLTAEEDKLIHARDLARTAYLALLEKETEIKNAALENNQVILTGPAIPPATPDSRSTLIKAGTAGLIGLLVGAMIALVLEMRAKRPA